MNANWITWTNASFNKHFIDNAGSYTVQLSIDDFHTQSESGWAMLHVDGPSILELPSSIYILTAGIEVTVQVEPSVSNIHSITDIAGYFADLFSPSISAYELGPSGSGDFWGCYTLQSEVEIVNFGKPEIDTNLLQATILGQYQMEI